MNLNTTIIGAAFFWALAWLLLPERTLNARPAHKRLFFILGALLGAAFLFVLLRGHG